MKFPSQLSEPEAKRLAKSRGVEAFTLLEVLIALSIFLLLIVGIYASWSQIHRATRVGLEAAADNQRKRVAMRALEQSLGSVKYFLANETNYTFIADLEGESSFLSFVSHLPDTFPRSAFPFKTGRMGWASWYFGSSRSSMRRILTMTKIR